MECNTNTHDVYGDLAICMHLREIQFTLTWRTEIPRAAWTSPSSLCKSLLLRASRFCSIYSPPSRTAESFLSRSTPPLTNPSLTKSPVRVLKLKSKSESNGYQTQSLGYAISDIFSQPKPSQTWLWLFPSSLLCLRVTEYTSNLNSLTFTMPGPL